MPCHVKSVTAVCLSSTVEKMLLSQLPGYAVPLKFSQKGECPVQRPVVQPSDLSTAEKELSPNGGQLLQHSIDRQVKR